MSRVIELPGPDHNQGRLGALRREERQLTAARSGTEGPSSGGHGAEPMAAPRYQAVGGRARRQRGSRPTADTLMDDLGIDEIWGEPAPHVAVTSDDEQQPWTARPSAGAYLLAAGFIFLALVLIAPPAYRVLELAWEGRLW